MGTNLRAMANGLHPSSDERATVWCASPHLKKVRHETVPKRRDLLGGFDTRWDLGLISHHHPNERGHAIHLDPRECMSEVIFVLFANLGEINMLGARSY